MNKVSQIPNSKLIQLFPEIAIKGKIANGGQKTVFIAEHQTYGKIALKLICNENSLDNARILREMATPKFLKGENFSAIYETGEKKFNGFNMLYIIEEFLEGKNLRDILKEKKLSERETLNIIKSILDALIIAHKGKIIHRDIKPENIFLTNNGRIVLLDFGIARYLELSSITRESTPFGPLTPGYAAPEQIRNEKRKIDSRTDLFQLGIVTYECLTGVNPFIQGTKNAMEAIKNNLTFEPVTLRSLNFSEGISFFVRKCIQKHMHLRFASSEDALAEIKKLLKYEEQKQ